MIKKVKLSFMAEKSVKKSRPSVLEKNNKELIINSHTFAGFANALFGNFVDNHSTLFSSLKPDLDKSGFDILSRTYFCELIFFPVLVYFLSLIPFFILFFISTSSLILKVVLLVLAPFTLSLFTFTVMFLYPSVKVKSRALNITNNLPFALNHMAAVTGSGIPPSALFELLTNFEEYGELSKEANNILKRIKVFGEDVITALRNAANKTPSDEFREVLYGIISTLESGGSLKEFLRERAKTALFEYKIRRKKYIQNLSVYASIYTAILVAAPLFLIAILSLLNLMGGSLFGLEIKRIMYFGTYVLIPLLNLFFILFLLWVQKEV